MKRKVSAEDLKQFMKTNYKSKADFRKKIDISQSHLCDLLNGDADLGVITLRKLDKECLKFGVNVENLLRPTPISVGDMEAEQINITKDGELIASITSRDVIAMKGYSVKVVPC